MAAEKKETTAKATGEKKTTPSLRKEADKNTFAKDLTVFLDDPKKIPASIHEANKVDVAQTALQRGLRTTGDVEVTKTTVLDDHNVNIVYTVSVEPNEITE